MMVERTGSVEVARFRLEETNKVTWHRRGPLMQQLIERVLAIGAGFAPKNRCGVHVDRFAVEVDAFAVALHVELLQIGRKPV